MKLAGSNSKYALVSWILVSALAACSGDDVNEPGTGGSEGTGGARSDAASDARDSGAGGADSTPDRADGRSDAAGGMAGTGGTGGDAATADREGGGAGGSNADARPDMGSAGTGGGTGSDAGDASADVAIDRPAPVPDANADGGTIDANEASIVDRGPDTAPTSDATDVTPSTSDASDVTPVPPDGSRAVCTPIPGGALSVYPFDDASEATAWEQDIFPIGPAMYPEPAADPPAWNTLDGCPDPGQLQFSIAFDSFAGLADDAGDAHPQGARFSAAFMTAPDWRNRSTLHIRLKVVTRGGLEFISPFTQLQEFGFTFNPNASTAYTAAMLDVGVWRDLTIDISQAPDAGIHASNIGFEVYARSPGNVVFVVDSIWVE